jgi:hypothetical protein
MLLARLRDSREDRQKASQRNNRDAGRSIRREEQADHSSDHS